MKTNEQIMQMVKGSNSPVFDLMKLVKAGALSYKEAWTAYQDDIGVECGYLDCLE